MKVQHVELAFFATQILSCVICAGSVVVQRKCGIGVWCVVSGHGESSHGEQHIFKTNKNRDGYDVCLTSNARFTDAGPSVSGLIHLGRLIHPESTKECQQWKERTVESTTHPRLVPLALVTLRGPLPTNDIIRLLGVVHRDDHS